MSKKKSSSLGKKLAILFGSLVGLFLLAAILVPLVVDVEKYRPTIVSKVNERINGKVEIGKLGLSFWGSFKVSIDGLKVTDASGNQVLAVKDADLKIPLLSVLTGRPELRLYLVSPEINIVKLKSGKLNAMTLMKETPAGAKDSGQAKPSGDKGVAKGETATEVPAMVLSSRVTLLLDHAKLTYKDQLTGDTYNVSDLNFRLEDVSPSSNMPFEVTANLDMLMQKKVKVTGPMTLEGEVRAKSSGGEFDSADAKASLKLDGLEISYADIFHKAKGVALGADMTATVGKDSFNVPTMKFRLADVTVDGKASGKTEGEATSIDFSAQSNRIDIEKLGGLSPLVKEYNLNGLVELAVSAKGPTSKLGYGANVKFNKITLNHESMKQSLEVNGRLAVETSSIKDLTVKLTAAKGFDLNMSGTMQNFAAPRFAFKLVSNEMDLDGLFKAHEMAAQARKERAKAEMSGSAPSSGEAANAPVVDYNAMFKPLRESPVAAATSGTFDFSLKKIKSTGVTISDMKGQLALNNLLLALKDFSLGVFNGTVKGNMSFNAKTAKPEVGSNLTVSGLDTQKMVESQMPIARNTIKGLIGANMNLGGSGLNHSDIISTWKGNGSMEIKNAVFSTLDIGKQVKEGLVDKLPPFVKGKAANMPDAVLNKQGQYETVMMKFALANGVFNINELNGKAHPNQGFDLRGGGTVKLADYGLDLSLDLVDTYNLLKLDQEIPDKRYGHFAASPKVGGTLFNPKFDWGATLGQLARNAAEAQGKKQLQKALGDKLPGGLGKFLGGGSGGDQGKEGNQPAPKPADAIKGALKGLFGR